jgi:hypothetical protein
MKDTELKKLKVKTMSIPALYPDIVDTWWLQREGRRLLVDQKYPWWRLVA